MRFDEDTDEETIQEVKHQLKVELMEEISRFLEMKLENLKRETCKPMDAQSFTFRRATQVRWSF